MANRRFLVGLLGVAAAVVYLGWTGVTETMVYYLTPAELIDRIAEDDSFAGSPVKIGGKVVEGSHHRTEGELLHVFVVEDLVDPSARFQVEYRDAVPDTFSDEAEVVLEGILRDDGVFEANTLLTKCGSRFEAAPEEFVGAEAQQG